MKVIENIATGQRFEIMDGALYPEKLYRDVTKKALEERKKMDLDFIEIPAPELPEPAPEPKEEPKPEPKPKKKAKKSRKKSSKKNDEKKS